MEQNDLVNQQPIEEQSGLLNGHLTNAVNSISHMEEVIVQQEVIPAVEVPMTEEVASVEIINNTVQKEELQNQTTGKENE